MRLDGTEVASRAFEPVGQRPGSGTFSASPLGWTHAQLIRLAWSLDAGRPVEQPAIVACRYAGECR
jgi:glucoamylase